MLTTAAVLALEGNETAFNCTTDTQVYTRKKNKNRRHMKRIKQNALKLFDKTLPATLCLLRLVLAPWLVLVSRIKTLISPRCICAVT